MMTNRTREHDANGVRWRGWLRCLLLVFVCCGLISLLYIQNTTFSDIVERSLRIAFAAQPQSTGVIWFDCHNDVNVQCGEIPVPLNYFNPREGTAIIYAGRLKATKSPKKGTILLNPGGPGGLGVEWFIDVAPLFAEMLGYDYDLVAFDPRGIGKTTPAVRCFPEYMHQRILESNTVLEQGFTVAPNRSDPLTRELLIAQYRQWDALKRTEARMCARNMGRELAYMGTANVVRDIAYMTDVLEGEGAIINFWGASYGTIIGVYLANMFPERVRRVLIDGVVNPVSWSNDPSHLWPADWLSSTEGTWEIFLRECAKVGPGACALARYGASADAIDQRIEDFIEKVYYHPLPVRTARRPGYLSAGAIRALIFDTLKFPREWQTFATHLGAAMEGDGTALLNKLLPSYRDEPGISYSNDMTRLAVTCLDSPRAEEGEILAENLADTGLATLREVSPHFGMSVSISEPDGGCEFWPVTGPERFTGPFNHTLAHPMLIVSNTVSHCEQHF